MDKREKEVLKEKLLLAVENVKKSFNLFFLCHYFIFISLSWGHLLQVLPQCQNLQQPFLRTSAEDLQLQHAHKHIETSGIKRVATLFPSDESWVSTLLPLTPQVSNTAVCLWDFFPIFYFRLSVSLSNHLKYWICSRHSTSMFHLCWSRVCSCF